MEEHNRNSSGSRAKTPPLATMPLWNRNNKPAAISNGTGYGGQANDTQKLIAGRKRALAQEHQEDAATIRYFQAITLENLHDETDKLIPMLRTTLRNQVPSEWISRGALYRAALDVCQALLSIPQTWGNPSDPESLIGSLREFASHADMVAKRAALENRTGDDVQLATRILKVHRKAEKAAKKALTEVDFLQCLSEQERYQSELGPLRFDICNNLQHHYFAQSAAADGINARNIFKELTAYKSALPVEHGGSIFVRAMNERLDLLRVLVIGPEGTPYANGCFLFDVLLPSNYPVVAPKVQFLSTGGGTVRFNPNLYKCGKVCLSLLGTWSGPGWVSGESTLLQVLVSIQSLVLVPDPYFNEPGYESQRKTDRGKQLNEQYNRTIRSQTVRLCIEQALTRVVSGNSPYPEFDRMICQHFLLKGRIVTNQLQQWAQQDSSLTSKASNIASLLSALEENENNRIRQEARGANPKQVIEITDRSGTGETIVIDEECEAEAQATGTQDQVIELDLDDDEESTGHAQAKKRAKVAQDDVVDLT